MTKWIWLGADAGANGYSGTNYSWSDPANWVGGQVPAIAAGDTVVVEANFDPNRDPNYYDIFNLGGSYVELSGTINNSGTIQISYVIPIFAALDITASMNRFPYRATQR